MNTSQQSQLTGSEIAIVGLAGRFPGAPDPDALWRNVRDGIEAVSNLGDDALRLRGISEIAMADPAYVRASVAFEGADLFDADFFGFSPRDAELLDPQQRLFLETAWQALEHAGYGDISHAGLVGIYAGCGTNLYLMRHLLPGIDWQASGIASLLGLLNGNDKDSLATRVAYKLNLRGPAVSIQTACSTSLVAVHQASRGLLNHEADMALAGGVWINLLQDGGYLYQPGAILSSDGHCRAFDAAADGTALGSGAGVVVLKRLSDALADGDTIHAVIKGSALNNDGAAKVGFTAPSIEGQSQVILAAQAMAEVAADSIGYIEAHGTGTTLGDPIEVAALTQAFRAGTDRRGYCAIGSIKTNIGHLDAAAGVAGLIKTVLALQHRTLPPSLNFQTPNPQIDFATSPFFVNTQARPWPTDGSPRRAGVSAFGMGGTNVHAILEEAPSSPSPAPDDGTEHLLMLSAKTPEALEAAIAQLADHLSASPDVALADVAHTLWVGRKRFEHRAVVVAPTLARAAATLRDREPGRFFTAAAVSDRPTVAFMFPGQGAQHANMAQALYESQPVFRQALDRCCDLLAAAMDVNLREVLFPHPDRLEAAELQLAQTALTQPALFAVEYALARLWISWGVQPDAMIGHSIGEYVAACIAGVFTLDDALKVVAARGRLLQATQPGAMLMVGLPEAELTRSLPTGTDLAAVNAADLCVLSGSIGAIDAAEQALGSQGVVVRRLHVSHAFHSALVEPMLAAFGDLLSSITLSEPTIPFVSNLTGTWITAGQARSPDYWLRHVRGCVRFADGLGTLLAKEDRLILEVGPGETLSALARRHPQVEGGRPVLSSQCHPHRRAANGAQPLRCLAMLWAAGIELDAARWFDGKRRRVPLPTYPFQRQSYWVDRLADDAGPKPGSPQEHGFGQWFHVPVWRRAALTHSSEPMDGCVLVIGQRNALTDELRHTLEAMACRVALALPGPRFTQQDDARYTLRLGEREDLEQLLRHVASSLGPVTHICHLACLDEAEWSAEDTLEHGFYSLFALGQAIEATRTPDGGSVAVLVAANHLEDVSGLERVEAAKAALHGPCKVMPQELSRLTCRVVDVPWPDDSAARQRTVRQLLAELQAPKAESLVACRGRHRWIKSFEALPAGSSSTQRLRRGGVYLVTGGLGGVGLSLARYLAEHWQARLVLLGRTALPPRTDWPRHSTAPADTGGQVDTLRALQQLESLGAEVHVLQADVADPAQMRRAIDSARQRFGPLNGVVHAAGIAGGDMMANGSRATAARILAAKVQGTQALLAAVAEEPLDFVMLCSSLASLTGGLGKAAYTAANAYLDATATACARGAEPTMVAVNWDGWRGVGMAMGMQMPDGVGIAPALGARAFEHIVNGPAHAQVVVSTTPLQPRLALEDGALLATLAIQAANAPRGRAHPRPRLPNDYVAPQDDLEVGLARLWSEVVGIEPVGVQDNLFELGGDSLLAIQLLAQVRRAYGVELSPAAFFKAPTLDAMAGMIEDLLIDQVENLAPASLKIAAAG